MDHVVAGLSNFAFYQTTPRGLDEFIELCDSPSPSAISVSHTQTRRYSTRKAHACNVIQRRRGGRPVVAKR